MNPCPSTNADSRKGCPYNCSPISPGESVGEELEALFVRFRKGRKKKNSLSEDVIILANFALVDDNIHKEHNPFPHVDIL